MEELACRANFSGRSQFGDLGSRTFQGQFEVSNDTFWGQNFIFPLNIVLHIDIFPIVRKSPQFKLVCRSYASHKLIYLVEHHGTKRMQHEPPLLPFLGLVMCRISTRL
jgi:hypothetical protein